MFLNQLSKEEKDAFISLSIHAANSNGVFANEEELMIQEYCREMGIIVADVQNTKSMDDVIAVFKESDSHIKKVVLFEILGLVYSDGTYDEEEKRFLMEYASKIGLTEDDVEKQTVLIKEYLNVLKKIVQAVE